MDRSLRSKLELCRKWFDEGCNPDEEYRPNVKLDPGPRIRSIRELYAETDPGAIDTDAKKRLEREYWEFLDLCQKLEPLLLLAGVQLRNGDNATVDGRILFWAIGEEPPPRRISIAPNVDAFRLAARAIDAAIIEQDAIEALPSIEDFPELTVAEPPIELFPERAAPPVPEKSPERTEQYVTLRQAANIVQRSKDTLEKLFISGKLPEPDIRVEPKSGRAHEWKWSSIRPALEAEYNRKLPSTFPSIR